MIIVNGIIFGLVLMVLVGPVFFTLIQTSIEKGFDKAVLIAMGIFLSDSIFITLAYFGVSQFIDDSGYNKWIGYIGGIILLSFGIYYLIKSQKYLDTKGESVAVKGVFRFIIKGFIINGVSPFVLVFWIGAMSVATVRYGYSGRELLAFFITTMTVVFSTDVLKAYLAGRLRKLLTPRLFKALNFLVGLTMIGFAIHMFTY